MKVKLTGSTKPVQLSELKGGGKYVASFYTDGGLPFITRVVTVEELKKKKLFEQLVRHTLVGKPARGTVLLELPKKRGFTSYSVLVEYENSDVAKAAEAKAKKPKVVIKPRFKIVVAKPKFVVKPIKKRKGFFDPAKVKPKGFVVRKVYPHKKFMDLNDLHDEEYYIVTLSTGNGCKTAVVGGYKLKRGKFVKRLSKQVPTNRRHWTGRHFIEDTASNLIEVMLPRDEKGRVLATTVTPWSMTSSPTREKNDEEFAALVAKYSV